MTACLPGAGGRKTSARSTSPSSTVIGTSQSMRIAALHTTARLDRHEGRAHIRATHAMAIRTNEAVADRGGIVPVGARVRPRRASLALRHESYLAWALLSPTLLVILFLVAYPFFSAISLSLQDKMVGAPGRFVGLDNYLDLFRDEVFLRTAWNSVVYTVVAVALKFVLGLTMALILDQERRFNNFFRALLFVPWAVPVVIVSLNWRWIYDDLSGFLNNFLITFHLTSNIISWLSDPGLAMACVIAVVVWAGTPLYSMTFLAGLQAIPRELYEAAEIDGASIVQQFFYVTVPRLRTIFLTTVMLSTIWTATNLQFVLILTHGGPANRTEIFPHLAYTTALGARRLGMGAAVSLVFFPILAVLILLLTRRMLRPSDD